MRQSRKQLNRALRQEDAIREETKKKKFEPRSSLLRPARPSYVPQRKRRTWASACCEEDRFARQTPRQLPASPAAPPRLDPTARAHQAAARVRTNQDAAATANTDLGTVMHKDGALVGPVRLCADVSELHILLHPTEASSAHSTRFLFLVWGLAVACW